MAPPVTTATLPCRLPVAGLEGIFWQRGAYRKAHTVQMNASLQ